MVATGGLGPQGPQGEIGATGGLGPQGPAGPQGLVWQGNFNPLDIYVQNDAVHFTDALQLPLRERGRVCREFVARWQ